MRQSCPHALLIAEEEDLKIEVIAGVTDSFDIYLALYKRYVFQVKVIAGILLYSLIITGQHHLGKSSTDISTTFCISEETQQMNCKYPTYNLQKWRED